MKTKLRYDKSGAIKARKDLFAFYDEKYFNLWLGKYEVEGLSRQQCEYVFKKFWSVGSVAGFPIIKPEKSFMGGQPPAEQTDGLAGFAPFAPQAFNMFDYPTAITLINTRAVPYIPEGVQVVGKDVVIGFAQHSRQPIRPHVVHLIEKIIDVEMTIRTNLIAHKMPVLIETNEKSVDKAQYLQDNLLNDSPIFFVGAKDRESFTSVNNGAPYIIDKLYEYKQAIENELLTFLGIDNIGFEKKERLVTDEANANNALINDHDEILGSGIKYFFDEMNAKFGFNISIKSKTCPAQAMEKAQEGESEDDNESI